MSAWVFLSKFDFMHFSSALFNLRGPTTPFLTSLGKGDIMCHWFSGAFLSPASRRYEMSPQLRHFPPLLSFPLRDRPRPSVHSVRPNDFRSGCQIEVKYQVSFGHFFWTDQHICSWATLTALSTNCIKTSRRKWRQQKYREGQGRDRELEEIIFPHLLMYSLAKWESVAPWASRASRKVAHTRVNVSNEKSPT